jgi:hypothetical protein
MTKNTVFWPGTGIEKSTGNAFTIRPAKVFDTPAERQKAAAQAAAVKTQTLKHLKPRNSGISISKQSDADKTRAIQRGGI